MRQDLQNELSARYFGLKTNQDRTAFVQTYVRALQEDTKCAPEGLGLALSLINRGDADFFADLSLLVSALYKKSFIALPLGFGLSLFALAIGCGEGEPQRHLIDVIKEGIEYDRIYYPFSTLSAPLTTTFMCDLLKIAKAANNREMLGDMARFVSLALQHKEQEVRVLAVPLAMCVAKAALERFGDRREVVRLSLAFHPRQGGAIHSGCLRDTSRVRLPMSQDPPSCARPNPHFLPIFSLDYKDI